MKIDLSYFKIPSSTQVFKIEKKITKVLIESIFDENSGKIDNRNDRFKDLKKTITLNNDQFIYSLLVFKYSESPSFLMTTEHLELKYAYILIIEFKGYLYVFRKNIKSPEIALGAYISNLDYNCFSSFKATEATNYEKVGLKNMTIANSVIRNRSFEGVSLKGILPTVSSSRSIANSFRLDQNGEKYTIVPNTSRLTFRSGKQSLTGILNWCSELHNEIETGVKSNDFIDGFAVPVKLTEVIQTTSPTSILFDIEPLDISVRENNTLELFYIDNDEKTILSKPEKDRLINFFKTPYSLIEDSSKNNYYQLNLKKHKNLFNIKLNENTISVKSKVGDSILISDGDNELTLTKYFNQNRLYSIVFDNPKYMYYGSSTFEDKRLLNNLESLYSVFVTKDIFSNVKSEKGDFKAHDSSFPSDSLFDVVEQHYLSKEKDSVVICDDMGEEWADLLIISTSGSVPELSLVHSKYPKKDSYGATSFHDVVSQALKNIGRLNSDVSEYKKKYQGKWKEDYINTKRKHQKTC